MVWYGMVWYGMVWYGMDGMVGMWVCQTGLGSSLQRWRGKAAQPLVWCGVVWCGVVWCGTLWLGHGPGKGRRAEAIGHYCGPGLEKKTKLPESIYHRLTADCRELKSKRVQIL